jgi:type III secretion system FlhB-like substrate exporter
VAGWELAVDLKLAAVAVVVWPTLSAGATTSPTTAPWPAHRPAHRRLRGIIVRAAILAAGHRRRRLRYQKKRNEKQMKMKREDIKQEHKDTEGDPSSRRPARRRRRPSCPATGCWRRRHRRRAGHQPDPPVRRPALRPDEGAPRVVAKGADKVADKLKAIARRTASRSPRQAAGPRAVPQCKVGQHVPAALYEAVAVVLATAYRRSRPQDPGAVAGPAGQPHERRPAACRPAPPPRPRLLSRTVVPFVLVGAVVTMVVPIPPALLDLLLAANLAFALLILLAVLTLRDTLDLSTFPSLILITTLMRLALNVSSTRLILLDGYAGKVIDTFGEFVVGGSVVVGLVVFLILVVIQFAVITSGAGRVAEVGARFALDAMPGKQMAIDADLAAGLIDEKRGRERRTRIARESDFYGAMDGASKFVKGDAIAGIVIVIINLIGGLVIGVSMAACPSARPRRPTRC